MRTSPAPETHRLLTIGTPPRWPPAVGYGSNVSEIDSGAWLLAGPRGRRLCWALLRERLLTGPAWQAVWMGGAPDSTELVAELAAALEATALVQLLGDDPARSLFAALAAATDSARYWQEPDGEDQALALPEVRRSLVPLAREVGAAMPAWWSGPLDVSGQGVIAWEDPHIPATSLTGVADKLVVWRADTATAERQGGERPSEVRAPYSGEWWSAPCLVGLPTSATVVPESGPVGLRLVEDSMGWRAASCIPIRPLRAPRVYEIARAQDWVELVARYPLDVSLSRRHDWWRATGAEGSWLIPDYAAISADYDAVHLTARAYLGAAGARLEVGTALTTVAGWNPDQTYWLTDCLTQSGPPRRWTRDQGTDTWSPST